MRPQEAKAKQAEFAAIVETRIQSIPDANAGRTRSLSERAALALAGEWYRWYTAQHDDNPGLPKHWEDLNTSPLKAAKFDPMNPPRPRPVKTVDRLGEWVRKKLGVTDKAIRPNHAWQHTFKRRAARARIDAGIRDAICGHSPRTVADKYESPTLEDMAEALKRLPRYDVASAHKKNIGSGIGDAPACHVVDDATTER